MRMRRMVAFFLAMATGLTASAQSTARRHVIRLSEIKVEGHIQKPEAFYILPRSPLNYKSLTRKETFLPKITQALKQDPF